MPYDGFCKSISEAFNRIFSEISYEYNFDAGPEFEIAICKALRNILPLKYGICRGFIVTLEGKTAGDDIIIYDQESYPTLRMIGDATFSRKEKIPAEAVYAYIEAKHTLYIEGDGGQSLAKSLSQIEQVKQLTRSAIPLNKVDRHITIGTTPPAPPEHWPSYKNPLYAGIFSRNLKLNASEQDSQICLTALQNALADRDAKGNIQPDFIIAGQDIVCLPHVGTQIESPFYVAGSSRISPILSKDQAVGVGLCSLNWAIDWIMLGTIHWPALIASGLKIPLATENQ